MCYESPSLWSIKSCQQVLQNSDMTGICFIPHSLHHTNSLFTVMLYLQHLSPIVRNETWYICNSPSMLPLRQLASLWSCTLTTSSGVYVSWLQSFSQTSQSFSHTSQSYNEVGTTILFDFNDQVSLCLGEREHPLLLQACVHLASSSAPSCLFPPPILIKFYPNLR